MLNKALSIIPGVKDPIGKFQLPEIPELPAIPTIPLQEEAPPVQTAAEGGVVGAQMDMALRESSSKSGDGATDADQLGTHSIRKVTPEEAHQRFAKHNIPSMAL